jgi:hypothetical protein
VGLDLGRILSGRIESREVINSNFLSFNPGSAESHRFVLAFRGGFSSRLTLGNFPFLYELSRILDDSGYEKPNLDSGASGVIRYSGGVWVIDELRFESKSRLGIRGSLTIGADKSLSGRLEVGLPARQISTFLSSMDSVFSPPREEMRWIDVQISGNTTAPQDDLAKRLVASMKPAGSSKASSGSDPRSQFEEATRPR